MTLADDLRTLADDVLVAHADAVVLRQAAYHLEIQPIYIERLTNTLTDDPGDVPEPPVDGPAGTVTPEGTNILRVRAGHEMKWVLLGQLRQKRGSN